jgi:alpha-glucosidase
MSKFTAFINALRFMGPIKTLHTVGYALERDRIERKSKTRRLASNKLPVSPGTWKSYRVENDTVVIDFSDYQLELSPLTPNIFRLTWLPGELPIPYSIEKPNWDAFAWQFKEDHRGLKIISYASCLYLHRNGELELLDSQDNLLRRENPPVFRELGWTHIAELESQECVFGLGLRSHHLNLRGGNYQMWNTDPGGTYNLGDDPLYLCIPAYIGWKQTGCFMVFYENPHEGEISFSNQAVANFTDGALRYYLITGSIAEILQSFTKLTGRPPLPPLWSLGYHQSRWGYESAAQIREIVDNFQKYHIPLDAVHLDIDHMDGYRVFTSDQKRFGKLANLANELNQLDIKLVTIIDPGVKTDSQYSIYKTGIESSSFVIGPDQKIIAGFVWPGRCAFPDFTSANVREWWGNLYKPLLEQGISGFWHDMNEPALFSAWGDPSLPRNARHDFEGTGGEHQTAHNIYGMLMNRAAYEGLHKLDPRHRPWILSRSGWAGNQRYAWNWTADVNSTWEMLKEAIPSLLNLSLTGIYYSGTDIGGFSQHPSKELYIRWFQLAAFTPFFRLHNATGLPPREPWQYDEETQAIVRELIKLRHAMLPYWYTLAYQATAFGKPLIRPMIWEDPSNTAFSEIDDQFMLGPHLLVAPVTEPGVSKKSVVLPRDGWYEFVSNKYHPGPGKIEVSAPLSHIPFFVRAGSIIPLEQNGRQFLNIYLPRNITSLSRQQHTSFWYTDAGDGFGSHRLETNSVSESDSNIVITHAVEGDYPSGGSIQIRFIGDDVDTVMVDGIKQKIQGNELSLNTYQEIIVQKI